MRLAIAVMLLVACKRDEVPLQPIPKDDAPAMPIDAPPPPVDAPAAAKPHATKIAVGDHASCAVMSDTTVRCWGKNSDGQLGDGTTTDRGTPVMPAVRGAVDIVVGTAHACALLDDQSVACWGRINFNKRENLVKPAAVPGLARAKRLFAVGAASCATTETGALVCWGDVDVRGHLRFGGEERRVPTPAAGLDNVKALAATGALHEDGTVSFWGADGTPQSTALTGVTEIAAAGEELCALRADGSIACVGPATYCAAAAPKPKPISKPKPARKDRRAKPSAKAPVAKSPLTPTLPIEVLKLPRARHLAFDVGLCAVSTAGQLNCLAGDNCATQIWPGLANIDTVVGNCARLRDGTVKCWAVDRKSRVVATPISGGTRATQIAASTSHACALLVDHSVVCWGSNKFSALGRSQNAIADDPVGRPVEF